LRQWQNAARIFVVGNIAVRPAIGDAPELIRTGFRQARADGWTIAELQTVFSGGGEDRFIAPDIEAATALVRGGSLSTLFRALPALPTLWTPA
jgi:hypothetical protein